MSLSSNQVMRYLALLADPNQNEITRQAWSVATNEEDLVWASWQPESVVSVSMEPPPEWYEGVEPTTVVVQRELRTRDTDRANAAYDLLKSFGILNTHVEPGHLVRGLIPEEPPVVPVTPPRGVDGDGLRRLASLDELHREEALGRVGWLFLAGSIRHGDHEVPCCFPLFERRVKFARVRGEFYPQWQGALRRHPILGRRVDDDVTDSVDLFLQAGAGSTEPRGLAEEVATMLREFDIELQGVAGSDVHPTAVATSAGTTLVPGTGFFLARAESGLSAMHNDLTRWTTRALFDSALAKLYRTTGSVLDQEKRPHRAVRSALPLNARQRQAIARLDVESVVAVSGPPGTGKTHMIVAAACDAVARGESVLIATKSDFAAESACELLDQYPTPPHIRFGREEQRRRVADMLSAGSELGIDDAQLASLTQAEDLAWNELEQVGRQVLGALERKQAFELARTSGDLSAASGAPHMLDPGFDAALLERTLATVDGPPGRRQSRSVAKLRKLIGASAGAPVEAMRVAIAGANAELAIRAALEQAAGPELDELWARLDRCETDARATQAVVDIARRSRPGPASLASISVLATALRSSLGAGRLTIPIEANASFLQHLPFWVGTLDEIETTLPANPSMFDLAIFDEASQIDQLAAVPALARARRALVVGDPKQLRHTSAITTQQMQAARSHAELRPGDDAAILDVAANSLFDVGASATAVTWLDEHFRSIPHLIEFSSQRWYGGQLRLMTQHPRNEGLDAIHIHRVQSPRVGSINPGEVGAIIEHLRLLVRQDYRGSVGVITPFEEQADALEQAVVAAFDYDAIRQLKLRVGTVAGVQGTERDLTLISLVIDDGDFGPALDMIQDPHVFNVMTTRARVQMDIYHSFDPAALPRGVLADWFRYEKNPPGLSGAQTEPASRWTQELARALRLGGLRIVAGYPVAGWSLDLVVGEGHAAFGVETTVHPDGAEAHAERHLTLRRAGWDLVSMFESGWLLQTEEAAIHLASIAARRAAG